MDEIPLDHSIPEVRDDHEVEMCEAIARIPGCQCRRSGCDPHCQIICSGELVTQDTINSLMQTLNDLKCSSEDWVHVKTLYVIKTKLVELDVTPFLTRRFEFLSISNNHLLTSIKGPSLKKRCVSSRSAAAVSEGENEGEKEEENEHEDHLIYAKSLHISFNPLMTDQGFGDTLKYFSPTVLYNLNLWGMNLTGSLGDGSRDVLGDVPEFLPGLSSFVGLHGLELAMNKISRLGGGQFRNNNKLTFLNLRKNDIKEIWWDAFTLDEIEFGDDFFNREYQTLVIGLDECQLRTEAFIDAHMEWTRQRAIHLDIWTNQLETLPASIFEPFLNIHPKNEIIVSDNPLVRDDRIQWLIDQKEKFLDRVYLTGPNTNGFNFEL